MKKFIFAMVATMVAALFVGGGTFAVLIFGNRAAAPTYITTEEPEEAPVPTPVPTPSPEPTPTPEPEETPCPYTVTILVSAAGDTTLGGDSRWGGYHGFMRAFEESGRDYGYFLAGVSEIFFESDLSIANLEGALTNLLEPHDEKEFIFRGAPHFAEVLSAGHIDAVTLANNHTRDYFLAGYNGTREALDAVGVEYFGNEINTIMEVNGINVGLFGYRIWADSRYNRDIITAAIEDLRERGAQMIIAYYHWGNENQYTPQPYQRNIGRFSIDQGADLVLGAHPHVIQPVEEYNGRYIVYSLANFCFGGNGNPSDKDSFIFQQTFTFFHGELLAESEINIIPILVSSQQGYNDFHPTIATGADAERIMTKTEGTYVHVQRENIQQTD
ncbi:MAG: CapA family protein [Clostridiales bacterium]|jgi:poly-gamma-glutamate synthesis protein (capsule biosynthesis protein)|nr:CapA family protein [Clostridiales bacterium]